MVVWGCLRLFGAALGYLELLEAVWGCLGLLRAARGFSGHRVLLRDAGSC